MSRVLIVGASRGLGASLATLYAANRWDVLGTTRSKNAPDKLAPSIQWLTTIDLMEPDVGEVLVSRLDASTPLDLVVRTASRSAAYLTWSELGISE